jgi:uncharacterized membrane protein YdjX (TVP38/TMEM64 family)
MRMRGTPTLPLLPRRRNIVRVAAGLLGAAGLWWLIASWGGRLGIEDVRAGFRAAGAIAPLAYVVVLAVSILLPPFPDVVMVIAAGLVFGFVPAIGYTLVGGLLGASGNFVLARRLGRPRLRAWLGPARYARVDALASRTAWLAVFLTRLLPGFNFDLVSYAAGVTRMSLGAFLTATLGGMFVPVAVLVTAGTHVAARPGLALLATAISVGSLFAVPALLWWLYRRGRLPLLGLLMGQAPRPEPVPSTPTRPEGSCSQPIHPSDRAPRT